MIADANFGCTAKFAYQSFQHADKVAAKIRRFEKVILGPYRCKLCSHWHVGQRLEQQTIPRRERRREE